MRVAVRDTEIFFDVEGAEFVPDGPVLRRKPTIILLHGGPGADHSRLKPAFSRLAEAAQLIYIDHRGHGRSARGSADTWTLDNWAEDIHEFCKKLQICKPLLLGVSFGGFVALRYAARYPDSLSGLILSSTRAHTDLEHIYAAFDREGGSNAAAVARNYWEKPTIETLSDYVSVCFPLFGLSAPNKDAARRGMVNPDVVLQFSATEHNSMDMRDGLGSVSCPTLILNGARDPINPLEDVREMVTAFSSRNVTFELFEDQRHNLSKDMPDKYFETIERWLSSNL
jgi:proline iminopeptidase